MKNTYAILQSTNFEEGTNAKILCIVENIETNDELRIHIKNEFDKLKRAVMDDMDEDMFTEEVAGLCYSLTQDYDDGDHPLIYEVYAQPIDKKSVHITNIKWDTDGEDIDLPSEVTINVDVDADGDEIVDKLSDEYGWCVLQASFEE